jgi:hypothetical protein
VPEGQVDGGLPQEVVIHLLDHFVQVEPLVVGGPRMLTWGLVRYPYLSVKGCDKLGQLATSHVQGDTVIAMTTMRCCPTVGSLDGICSNIPNSMSLLLHFLLQWTSIVAGV